MEQVQFGPASRQRGGLPWCGRTLHRQVCAVFRPADRQASGQGAARLPAERPTQGGEPGAQETESRLPGMIWTSVQRRGVWGFVCFFFFAFPFKPQFVYIFLICYKFEATFVHVK